MQIILKPIGVVHTPYNDGQVSSSFNGVEGIIEIYPEYADGLKGIDGFSHIIILAYLHKIKEENKKIFIISHRRFLRFGFKLDELPRTGVFASDSPVRPNPIALTIVRLIRRDGNLLYVSGLDLFDGTPVLDIKPYTPSRRIENISLPSWYEEFYNKVARRIGVKEL
ncbi:MAG: tRNA (N6-threonylcarbamoyladenosine(37)-N6)-methyltransferase TrmO [archaeon GB-1867-035]|nr:tRNA (N6-threonylcarbamoyladenosine(37)-N6)-methyltransferase TrmO [Candidatus Culexmicrobium profundum]